MMTIFSGIIKLILQLIQPKASFMLLVMLLSVAISAYPQDRLAKKPNIVFIMSDDHAYQTISAYDSKLINTPAIDRIAREGALFKKAFVTNSICGPSRAVILTGKYSHINGFMDNNDRFNGDQQTLPKVLRNEGYRTAIVGKWHLNSEPQGFDYWNILPGQGEYYQPNFNKMGKETVYKGYVTDVTTDLALEWIADNKDKPFFLMIHQKAPHRNQMPPLENLNLFSDRKFDLPANFYDDYKNREALKVNKIRMADNLDFDQDSKVICDTCPASKNNRKAYQRGLKRLTPEQRKLWDKAYAKEQSEFLSIKDEKALAQWQYQRFMQDYLRCIKSVDDNVDRVLKYLDAQGLAENTIVVYTSDQGFYLGEHGLYDKRFMYEESFRTPMMIRYPKAIKAGKQIDQFVLNLDIAPTLLQYAGAKVPADMQGASVKNVLDEKKPLDWRENVYYHYYEKLYGLSAHYGLRTDRYKLIHFYDPVDSWELYDLKEDPNEMKNLYKEPKHAQLIAKLKAELKKQQIKYQDPIAK
jgi:arylsulfatase A-like enzyme